MTGVVGAAGGLGGLTPAVADGFDVWTPGDYSLGSVLLAIVALSVAAFTATVVRRGAG